MVKSDYVQNGKVFFKEFAFLVYISACASRATIPAFSFYSQRRNLERLLEAVLVASVDSTYATVQGAKGKFYTQQLCCVNSTVTIKFSGNCWHFRLNGLSPAYWHCRRKTLVSLVLLSTIEAFNREVSQLFITSMRMVSRIVKHLSWPELVHGA